MMVDDGAAKPNQFWVELGWVGAWSKIGPIGSGWPQIGFKLAFNPLLYKLK